MSMADKFVTGGSLDGYTYTVHGPLILPELPDFITNMLAEMRRRSAPPTAFAAKNERLPSAVDRMNSTAKAGRPVNTSIISPPSSMEASCSGYSQTIQRPPKLAERASQPLPTTFKDNVVFAAPIRPTVFAASMPAWQLSQMKQQSSSGGSTKSSEFSHCHITRPIPAVARHRSASPTEKILIRECFICLQLVDDEDRFTSHCPSTCWEKNNWAHKHCMINWLSQNRTCPFCRRILNDDDNFPKL